MRRRRAAGATIALVATGGLLSGCQVNRQLGAECWTSPPVPHHNYGTVEFRGEIPHEVTAGEPFEIQVDYMVGYAGPPGSAPGGKARGTIAVTGAVEPAGSFAVGRGPGLQSTLGLTATGEPGDTITVAARSGSSTRSGPLYMDCSVLGDGELATITIVAPV